MTIWRFLKAIGAGALVIAFAIPVLFFLAVIGAFDGPSSFDDGHPDHDRYTALFQTVSERKGGPTIDDRVDFSQLNGGDWLVACLLGGYNDPVRTLNTLGARVTEGDRKRMAKRRYFTQVSPIEEFEAAIIFVDGQRLGHIIHFGRGFGTYGQHYSRCTAKSDTVLTIGPVGDFTPPDYRPVESFRLPPP